MLNAKFKVTVFDGRNDMKCLFSDMNDAMDFAVLFVNNVIENKEMEKYNTCPTDTWGKKSVKMEVIFDVKEQTEEQRDDVTAE